MTYEDVTPKALGTIGELTQKGGLNVTVYFGNADYHSNVQRVFYIV